MSTVTEGKDTIKFVDEEQINKAAADAAASTSNEAKEEKEDAASAFNPETGEINWDCPCLGGMAQGPCGEEFKAAFSCFVFSEAEPKGLDCVEKFKGMQDCFRLHPDVYGDEIDDDDEEEEEPVGVVTEEVVVVATPNEDSKEEEPTTVASSAYEEEPASSFSSWVSSWFQMELDRCHTQLESFVDYAAAINHYLYNKSSISPFTLLLTMLELQSGINGNLGKNGIALALFYFTGFYGRGLIATNSDG